MNTPLLRFGRHCAVAAAFVTVSIGNLHSADLSSSYSWRSVEIGGGGLVTGIVHHPADGTVRYARTDVGGAYRWNNGTGRWERMVRRENGEGLPASVTGAPAGTGVSALAVDPTDARIVYMALTMPRPTSMSQGGLGNSVPGNVYKSTDGGRNFTALNLAVALDANDGWRGHGERMAVDPRDPNRIFFGSSSQGLWRTTNGRDFVQVTWNGAPPSGSNVIGVRCFNDGSKTITYAIVGDGDVFRTQDGGHSWTNLSTGSGISGVAGYAHLDHTGKLWVARNYSRDVWIWNGTSWTSRYTNLPQNLKNVAVDPGNPSRVFALSDNGGLSRSLDGGATWTRLAEGPVFGNTQGWLPQPRDPTWHGVTGIAFDANRHLWIAQGNEGVLYYPLHPTNNPETPSQPPAFHIRSLGIEEMISHQIIIPKNGGGVVHAAFQDTTGFTIRNPDSVDGATWVTLQDNLISNSVSVAAAPGSPDYVVMNSNVEWGPSAGTNYSGYTPNGGVTWSKFSSRPPQFRSGPIAVSRRGSWGLGSDHLVWLPGYDRPPHFSKDGGASWTPAATFAVNSDGRLVDRNAFSNLSLKQNPLFADPFVADRFYLKFLYGGFWVSNDGGVNWTMRDNSQLPDGAWHSQLAVNHQVQDNIWFASGFDGTYFPGTWQWADAHGLWRSNNGGSTWTKIAGVQYTQTVALGAGRGQSGDAPYTAYFYGKLTNDPEWGIFRSTDAGSTWDRISRYPAGIIDHTSAMAASWDTFGLVYVGFHGTSLAVGSPTGAAGVRRDYWTGIGGETMPSLYNDPRYYDIPTGSDTLANFQAIGWAGSENPGAKRDYGATYGQRLYAILTAPTTGDYTFWVGGDDHCELWLSPDTSAFNSVCVAWVYGWNTFNDSTGQPNWLSNGTTTGKSSNNAFSFGGGTPGKIRLVAGQRYWIEVNHKEGYGGDHVTVGWSKPGESTSAPSEILPGSVLTRPSTQTGP